MARQTDAWPPHFSHAVGRSDMIAARRSRVVGSSSWTIIIDHARSASLAARSLARRPGVTGRSTTRILSADQIARPIVFPFIEVTPIIGSRPSRS